MRYFMIALMALSVPAAAQALPGATTTIGEISRLTNTATSRISTLEQLGDKSCSGLKPSEKLTDGALDLVSQASRELTARPGAHQVTIWNLTKILNEGGPIVAQSYLDLAGAYQRWGCKDDAKRVYLQVISTFTGSNYAAYRELASEGLADLRAEK
jgi:hypothetical protein